MLVVGAIVTAVLATVFTLVLKAGRTAVEEVSRATDQSVAPAIPDPRQIRPGRSLFEGENFGRALAALRRREGGAAAMVKVQVHPYGVDFHLRRGESEARGYQWLANERKLRTVLVRVIGGGSLDDEDFPLELVRDDAVRKLAARVSEEGPAFEPRVLTLERVPPDGYLLWSVLASGSDSGSEVWNARPNGTGFSEPGRFAERFRAR